MTEIQFAYPTTVDEAVGLLGAASAAVIAGGTAVAGEGAARGASLLVDVTRCGLDRIEVTPAAITLGAAVRVGAIGARALPATAEGELLVEAAQGIASQPLRNTITLGGNLVHLCRWADMPAALLTLGATVQARHATQGALSFSIDELVAQHPKRVLPEGSLVTGVTVPLAARPGAARGATYSRFRTTVTDYPLLTCAVVLELTGEKCTHAAVALGSLTPRPQRAAAAEALLVGEALTPERIAEAAARAAAEAQVAPNFRMAKEPRTRILVPVLRRAIETAANRARLRAGGVA